MKLSKKRTLNNRDELPTQIWINEVEYKGYIYLGQTVSLKNLTQNIRMQHIISAGIPSSHFELLFTSIFHEFRWSQIYKFGADIIDE